VVLHTLKPRKRIDLFFFYKECLTNIIRHSGATQVTAQVTATNKAIRLTVTDNGHGMKVATTNNNNGVPSSLKRRARLLGARVSAEHPEGKGMHIVLKLKTRQFGVRT
ncbi:sensor histidine kinase, partial [Planctomycetota bacterium]